MFVRVLRRSFWSACAATLASFFSSDPSDQLVFCLVLEAYGMHSGVYQSPEALYILAKFEA